MIGEKPFTRFDDDKRMQIDEAIFIFQDLLHGSFLVMCSMRLGIIAIILLKMILRRPWIKLDVRCVSVLCIAIHSSLIHFLPGKCIDDV